MSTFSGARRYDDEKQLCLENVEVVMFLHVFVKLRVFTTGSLQMLYYEQLHDSGLTVNT